MIRETKPVGLLGCNCTILGDPHTKKAYIIDPGGDGHWVRERLSTLGLTPVAILITHAHIDHVVAAKELSEEYDIPVRLHSEDNGLYAMMDLQSRLLGLPRVATTALGSPLKDREMLEDLQTPLEVLHTPGHSPGSVCFFLNTETPLLLAGDTLFAGSIGRTDLWGGSYDTIMNSIHSRLLKLPEHTHVITGHGEDTTLLQEKRLNPFLQ